MIPVVLDVDLLNYLHRVVGRSVIHDVPLSTLELRTYLVSVDLLKNHEEVIKEHLTRVVDLIEAYGGFKHPILVDVRTFTVLDRHHRLEAAKLLVLKYVPIFFVDYAEDYVEVTSWRREFIVGKKEVSHSSLSQRDAPTA